MTMPRVNPLTGGAPPQPKEGASTMTPVRPANRRAGKKQEQQRRQKQYERKRVQRQHRKDRRIEAARDRVEVARRQADTARKEEDLAKQQARQKERDRIEGVVNAYREKQTQEAAARLIQTAWRSPAVRSRYARAFELKIAARRQLARATRTIRTAWQQYQAQKATAHFKSRVDEKMAPYRQKRADLMRAEEEAEAKAAEEAMAQEAARSDESEAVGVGASRKVARKFSWEQDPNRIRIGDILKVMIRGFMQRQAEAAAAKAAADARVAAEAERVAADAKETEIADAQREELKGRLLLVVTELLGKRKADEGAREAADKKELEYAKFRDRLHLPSARKHAAGAREELVTYPLQLLDGQALMYSQSDVDLWTLMGQMQGWSLCLGEAPVWGGGLPRAGEEFSAVCGFSAAFGPLLFTRGVVAVFGKFFAEANVLPPEHVTHMFKTYWEKEVAPFDAAERLYRLVGNARGGGIRREDLKPFIQAIADRHPELVKLPPNERSGYVNTVLAIVFYKHSRCGVINLRDLRDNSFVASLNSVGRQEKELQSSEYFSLTRHFELREDYSALCGKGWTVGCHALQGYRSAGGRPVGAVRSQRVLDAGLRPFPIKKIAGNVKYTHAGGRYGRALDYDAFVSFALCEEALRVGTFSGPDIRYCFAVMDEMGMGKIGPVEVGHFYEDMMLGRQADGLPTADLPTANSLLLQHLDGLGVNIGLPYVTLDEMVKPRNVQRAGSFFKEVFSGTDLDEDLYTDTPAPTRGDQPCQTSSMPLPPPPPSPPTYPPAVAFDQTDPGWDPEFERELEAICPRGDTGCSWLLHRAR